MAILSPATITLKKASPADAEAITKLAERIWRIHYPPIIGAEQVEYMLATMHTAAHVKAQMEKGQSFSFILDGENAVGYVATSQPSPGELFIHKFYVDPASQGKGIGKKVFAGLLEINPQATTIRLTVNRMNYKSINFYFSVGFVIEEVKDFDIGGGYFMNDFVMRWNRERVTQR